jgi:hypothetical protein
VKAIVQQKAGAAATEEEIIAACKQRLGSVMAPKSVELARVAEERRRQGGAPRSVREVLGGARALPGVRKRLP